MKDYSTCSSAEKLFGCCCQNAMISFMEEQKLAQSLRFGNYLYGPTFQQAVSDRATSSQICHAYMEIERYCYEHHDCEGELSQMFTHELHSAFAVHGQRIPQLIKRL